ncbi:MAG: hypothetical protein ACRD3C_20195 [Vicinamibacterales bacterium]
MSHRVRAIVLATIAAALVAFLVVQDRVTAAGAGRYVALQRRAQSGQGPPVTIDEVMTPAVQQSVRAGLRSAGIVLVVGLGLAIGTSRRERVPRPRTGAGVTRE